MTDLSKTGLGATVGDGGPTAAPKPKAAPKTSAKTAKPAQDPMAENTKTTGAASTVETDETSRLRATLQKIEARADELRRWGMARQDMAREVVEERPLAVVGTAFGVGLLLGLIASRL